MGIAETLRNQNYGGIIFNKNNPTNLGGGGVQGYADEEYKDMSPIEAVAKSITNFRNATSNRSNQQVISDLINSQNTMYGSAMSNRNKSTSAEEMKAAQLDAFAAIVKGRAIEDGYEQEWSGYNTTKDIISHYIDLNNSESVNKRLVQYANSEEDPYDFAMSLGVLLSPEQKRIRNAQAELDTLFGKGNTPKWLAKTYDFLGNQMRGGLSSWVDPIEKGDFNEMFANSDSDESPILGAIENYSYRTFGKHINNLDEYEMNKILNDLKDTETLKKYLPNEATAIANKFEGATYGALSTAFPVATLSLEGISSIPVVGDIASWTLRNLSRAIGQALTYSILSPLAGPLSYNLNNEDERLDLYEALGALFIWRDHENNGGATTRGKWDKKTEGAFNKFLHSDAKESLGGKLGEEVVNADETKVNAGEGQTVLGWIINKVKENKELKLQEKESKIKEKMNEKANQSLVDPEIWQSEQAANAYSQLSPEAIKRIQKSKNKSKTVLEELDKISKAYENAENAIVDTIDEMYGIDYSYEDPISTKQGGKEYTSNIPEKYVDNWIKIMKEVSEYQQEKQYIDLAEQIARDGNLTPYNIIEMARSLSKQFDLWSVGKEGPELSKMKARVDATRQGLKNILKRALDKSPERQETGVNPLEYYDSLWSPVIGTRSNIVKLRSAWNKAKSRMNKTTLNRVLGRLGKIPFTKEKAIRESLNAAKSLGGENILDLVTKEKNLGNVIKEVNNLSKKLSGDPTKAYIDEVMSNWEKEHPGMMSDIGELLEGEVIEPESKGGWTKGRNRYLEEMFDTVEIETTKGLLENEGVGPDLQEPIVSDENGYVGRRGKTTESYKGQTKGEGWTPADWNKSAENYAAKHGNTLETWKKQLEAAGISPEAIEVLIEKLAKKNFKSSSVQPPLF